MKVIKSDLKDRQEMLISQWKVIKSSNVNNKAYKLSVLDNWIQYVNNELGEVNSLVIKEAKVNKLT
jgi:hypothetical protein